MIALIRKHKTDVKEIDRIIRKFRIEKDITLEESRKLSLLFSAKFTMQVMRHDKDLFAKFIEYLNIILENLKEGRTGDFIMYIPLDFRNCENEEFYLPAKTILEEIRKALPPLDRAVYVKASDGLRSMAGKESKNMISYDDCKPPSVTNRAGLLRRMGLYHILSVFVEAPSLGNLSETINNFFIYSRGIISGVPYCDLLRFIAARFANISGIPFALVGICDYKEMFLVSQDDAQKLESVLTKHSKDIIDLLKNEGLISIRSVPEGKICLFGDGKKAVNCGVELFSDLFNETGDRDLDTEKPCR